MLKYFACWRGWLIILYSSQLTGKSFLHRKLRYFHANHQYMYFYNNELVDMIYLTPISNNVLCIMFIHVFIKIKHVLLFEKKSKVKGTPKYQMQSKVEVYTGKCIVFTYILPVIKRLSFFSRHSVKSLITNISGQMRNWISSWSASTSNIPPPKYLLAKFTWNKTVWN